MCVCGCWYNNNLTFAHKIKHEYVCSAFTSKRTIDSVFESMHDIMYIVYVATICQFIVHQKKTGKLSHLPTQLCELSAKEIPAKRNHRKKYCNKQTNKHKESEQSPKNIIILQFGSWEMASVLGYSKISL